MKLRGLYAITPEGVDGEQLIEQARLALEGGIALLQYRRKSVSTEARFVEAGKLLRLARSHRVPFIVNDDVELALALEADGVHVGRDVFASPTKPLAVRAPLSLFKNDLGVPLCAIGGITLDNARQVIEAGADLLAVVSDLFDAPDIRSRAREYERLFK